MFMQNGSHKHLFLIKVIWEVKTKHDGVKTENFLHKKQKRYFWNVLFMVLRLHIDSKKLAFFGKKYENDASFWNVTSFHTPFQSKLISNYL